MSRLFFQKVTLLLLLYALFPLTQQGWSPYVLSVAGQMGFDDQAAAGAASNDSESESPEETPDDCAFSQPRLLRCAATAPYDGITILPPQMFALSSLFHPPSLRP